MKFSACKERDVILFVLYVRIRRVHFTFRTKAIVDIFCYDVLVGCKSLHAVKAVNAIQSFGEYSKHGHTRIHHSRQRPIGLFHYGYQRQPSWHALWVC